MGPYPDPDRRVAAAGRAGEAQGLRIALGHSVEDEVGLLVEHVGAVVALMSGDPYFLAGCLGDVAIGQAQHVQNVELARIREGADVVRGDRGPRMLLREGFADQGGPAHEGLVPDHSARLATPE